MHRPSSSHRCEVSRCIVRDEQTVNEIKRLISVDKKDKRGARWCTRSQFTVMGRAQSHCNVLIYHLMNTSTRIKYVGVFN